MREQAPPIDIKAYQTPEFSHAETLEITGLTADTLLTWHKRGVVPDSEGTQAKGRGHRRKYSELDLAFLTIMKHLAPIMPLAFAAVGAANASALVLAVNQLAEFRETVDELVTMPGLSLLAYHDPAGIPRFDLVGDCGFPGLDPLPEGGIAGWMRQRGVVAAIALDLKMIALTLCADAQHVRERRLAQ